MKSFGDIKLNAAEGQMLVIMVLVRWDYGKGRAPVPNNPVCDDG
jgi:hypothetical protein